MQLTSATMSTLLGGWSEGQVVLLVLGFMVVGVAMLSYFVIAPEYEKHLTKEYDAFVHETQEHRKSSSSLSSSLQPVGDHAPTDEQRRTMELLEMEAAFSDDENEGAETSEQKSETNQTRRRASNPEANSDVSRQRKYEKDELRQTSMNKAEMLRRRVLLRKLEQEIDGAIHETNQKATTHPAPRHMYHSSSGNAFTFSAERLSEIQNHPADCTSELELLARMTTSMKHTTTMKQALTIIHDVLCYNLSSEHRDMNKVTVFCNSLLKHDGLNHLRLLEHASDVEVRSLANDIIEKAVPAIWH